MTGDSFLKHFIGWGVFTQTVILELIMYTYEYRGSRKYIDYICRSLYLFTSLKGECRHVTSTNIIFTPRPAGVHDILRKYLAACGRDDLNQQTGASSAEGLVRAIAVAVAVAVVVASSSSSS